MPVATVEKELDLNGVNYLVEIEVVGKLVDESFSHAFGVESASSTEIVSSKVDFVYNEDGETVCNEAINTDLQSLVDLIDFSETKFYL